MIDQPGMNNEPSIWDVFSEKLKHGLKAQPNKEKSEHDEQPTEKAIFPWLTVCALVFAIAAQLTFEPSPGRTLWPGIVLYGGSLSCLITAMTKGEWKMIVLKNPKTVQLSTYFRLELFIASVFSAIFAFVFFSNGKFGLLNISAWALSILFFFLTFWPGDGFGICKIKENWKRFLKDEWRIKFTRWTLITLAVIAVILFFNFVKLDTVPPEMVSDQAEKLMDINDILQGQRPVYFTRNTGREALHFYLSAGFMHLFNLDVTFLNLKIVAVFANLLTLFFIYLLGKEFGDKWVGLTAVLFAGMAYWPLLFTRLALRIPYYPLFVGPVMLFLVRGLRRQDIRDILWTGFFLGLGLHGYTPFRIVPLLVVIGVLIYIVHTHSKEQRIRAVYALMIITIISLIVFIPLLRYWLANPQLFAYRAFSRLTGMEVGFAQSPVVIFFQNFWRASVMFFWDNGVIWAHSIPNRPALEVVSAALYFLGIASLLIRYILKRDWQDLFLLISIPVLMLPSILSLAYPGENPSLNRTAGAVVPVFLVIGLSFVALIRTIKPIARGKLGKGALIIGVVLILVWSAANNYDLVFNQYYTIYRASSWNTSEIGRIATLFIDTLGSPETTYVVGYPHWVDSRLVAINSGHPGLDYAIFPNQIPGTVNDPRAKMFFVNLADRENLTLLEKTFPQGVAWVFDSETENKDFIIFFVAPTQGVLP